MVNSSWILLWIIWLVESYFSSLCFSFIQIIKELVNVWTKPNMEILGTFGDPEPSMTSFGSQKNVKKGRKSIYNIFPLYRLIPSADSCFQKSSLASRDLCFYFKKRPLSGLWASFLMKWTEVAPPRKIRQNIFCFKSTPKGISLFNSMYIYF